MAGSKSGELDVVIEHPFAPTMPMIGGVGSAIRLYPAESVAAVIEVKSNVEDQWKQVLATAEQLAPLQRQFTNTMTMGTLLLTKEIPFFAVGYQGWKTMDTAAERLADASTVAGMLIIDPGIFVSSNEYRSARIEGPAALWSFISILHETVALVQAASSDPASYALG